jgi:sortase A
MTNPLFPQDDENPHKNPLSEGPQYGSALKREPKRIEPLAPENNAAANIIRQKLQSIYSAEPNAEKELAEAEKSTHPRSKHQQFMEGLERSGKTVPQIQEAWHDYYAALSDKEKHEVWQEFYSAAATLKTKPNKPEPTTPLVAVTAAETTGSSVVVAEHQPPPSIRDRRSVASIRRALLSNLERQATTKLKARDHLKSLGFGLASGVIVIAIFLFSFFNEIIIAPFIQPSRHVGSLPLIVDATTASATSTPEVIIPKINVEIPVDYSETSDNESVIENDLQNGVVHYPDTVLPGENGNAAFFGHSSNNIFNPGKYKFAFVLLHTLVDGDTFYLTNNGKVYIYQVVDHKVVAPSDVSVLNDTEGHQATATLITCDPPGTSINRLVVTGVQISPNPSTNNATPASPQVAAAPTILASNGPTLWNRLTSWLF